MTPLEKESIQWGGELDTVQEKSIEAQSRQISASWPHPNLTDAEVFVEMRNGGVKIGWITDVRDAFADDVEVNNESLVDYWEDDHVEPGDGVLEISLDEKGDTVYSWPASKVWLAEEVTIRDDKAGGECPACGGPIADPVERYDGVVFCSIGCLNDSA